MSDRSKSVIITLRNQKAFTLNELKIAESKLNKAITTNSLNLNASVPLYNGGQINQSINQAKIDAKATAADLEQTTNSLALQVASAYLTVLLNQEQLQNTKNQVELSRKQLINTQKLIDIAVNAALHY